MKNNNNSNKNAKESIYVNISSILYCELAPLTRDVTCSNLSQDTEKRQMTTNCQWNTLST